MATSLDVDVRGLDTLVRDLRGPMWRDVNRELRGEAKQIAATLAPIVAAAVAQSGAPQAAAVAATVRAHSDRVPVVVVGKTNPRLGGFTRRGPRKDGGPRADVKLRRGSLAHGVVYGPLGGRRHTGVQENYYRIGRDTTGGPLGRALADAGPAFDKACDEYLAAFLTVMGRHGWPADQLRKGI